MRQLIDFRATDLTLDGSIKSQVALDINAFAA